MHASWSVSSHCLDSVSQIRWHGVSSSRSASEYIVKRFAPSREYDTSPYKNVSLPLLTRQWLSRGLFDQVLILSGTLQPILIRYYSFAVNRITVLLILLLDITTAFDHWSLTSPSRFLQYDNIDAEHKAIFECIFNCAKDPKSAPLITKLYDVTADHFTDEEVSSLYLRYQFLLELFLLG